MVTHAEDVKEITDAIAEQRACPGILIFSASLKLLWADRHAWILCRKVKAPKEPMGSVGIPQPILDVCRDVLSTMKGKTKGRDWDTLRIKRTIKEADPHLLVCGFVLQESSGPAHPRILLVLEEIGRRQDSAAEQAKEFFHLTNRELLVVRHLLKGLSNKEIAHEIHVTEQTVKEYIQRIMAKTKSSSRSGILLRILFL